MSDTASLEEPQPPKRKRRKTETSSFGVSARESHDASRYYDRAIETVIETKDATVNPSPVTDALFCHTSEAMGELVDNSVALMVTSPSYHVGKALRSSELVLTPSGWAKIGELRRGDIVVALDGGPTEVTGVHPQGIRQLWRVTFDDHTFLDVDGDHLWLVQTYGHQKSKTMREHWQVLTTDELRNRWGAHPEGPYAVRIPTAGPPRLATPGASYPVDGYTLGVLLGDGTMIEGGYARVALGASKMGVLAALPYETVPYSDGRSWGIPGLGPALRSLGLDHCVAPHKFTPKRYLWANEERRLAVLRGLMDTDGSHDKAGHTEFSSSSPQLVEDVEFLVRSLGGKATRGKSRTPTYEYRGEKRRGRQNERTLITIPVCPFLHRSVDAWELTRSRRVTTDRRIVRSIEAVDVDDATCITVADPAGCFVAKDFIVTHNSYDLDVGFVDFLAMLYRVFKETYRVLERARERIAGVVGPTEEAS